jgi:hypothetical protein
MWSMRHAYTSSLCPGWCPGPGTTRSDVSMLGAMMQRAHAESQMKKHVFHKRVQQIHSIRGRVAVQTSG